ncbi:MAG: ankyrin repeat domain-containing protein [Victivallaceae bacterium]|nr:ankyrin repeat domain-containing protein [Victivallaceae bacterium]
MRKKDTDSTIQEKLDAELLAACSHGKYSEIKRLLNDGANPNAVADDNWDSALTELILSSEYAYGRVHKAFWKTLDLMLERGCDVNLVLETADGHVNTALFSAQYTIPEVTAYLLDHGADPNVVDMVANWTVLDEVEFRQISIDDDWEEFQEYWNSNIRIQQTLLDHGAHRESTLACMEKSKHWRKVKRNVYNACWNLDARMLDMTLTGKGIQLPQKSLPFLVCETMETAAEFTQRFFVDDAAGYEKRLIETLEILRKHGCDLDKGGALYYAVRGGYVETTRYLLDIGVDPDKCDCGGCSSDVHGKQEFHPYTLADRVLAWRGRWKKETARFFLKTFPMKTKKSG